MFNDYLLVFYIIILDFIAALCYYENMIRITLSRLLGEKRITQKELSDLTGISENSIRKLYHDKATMIQTNTLDVLCRALNCRPEDLFEYIPDEPEEKKDA